MIERKLCGPTKGECWRVITNKELNDPRKQRNHKIHKIPLTQQVGNGHTPSGMEKDCTGSLRPQQTVMFNL